MAWTIDTACVPCVALSMESAGMAGNETVISIHASTMIARNVRERERRRRKKG
ncbi:hypothetical protein [Dyella sp. 2HG41-7]|uniref:hypothetical protein n=1 Tax=Dyella sp. 2HG41-7 TaxID=2883239 RepID=UPI001F1E566B|nr:hypothetical protein [Dyella sp. 2HG41-7]